MSYNKDLGGTLGPSIGNLGKLTTLILIGCSLTGNIPEELGNLSELSFLALNSNKFTGTIPNSLGNLSKLYWLDIADNNLTGMIPISSETSSGLDKLVNTKHFHFSKNRLSGEIPAALFNSDMKLIHVLFDANLFTGKIPDTIRLVTNLEVLRLDRNQLTGPIPSGINNLTSVNELNLANNRLTGIIPDLSRMRSLNYVDLSNNSFDDSEVPSWFSIPSLTTLVIQSGELTGLIPDSVFEVFQLQQVILSGNKLYGSLDIRGNISPQLQLLDLRDNEISHFTVSNTRQFTILLIGNPFCKIQPANTQYCSLQLQDLKPYSTSLAKCGNNACLADQDVSPNKCTCAYPYKGTIIFRAPTFSDLMNDTRFRLLENDLHEKLNLSSETVSIRNPFFNNDNYLQLELQLFPPEANYFNRSEIVRLGFSLSNQAYKAPHIFGPYFFMADPYPFQVVTGRKSTVSKGVVIGIAIGCAFLSIAVVTLAIYAFRQRIRAKKSEDQNRLFAPWDSNDRGNIGAQFKRATWFSFNELGKCTDNFSRSNEVGSGGYGKVYRGTLPSGHMVAVKRAQRGSIQGIREFKTEIELLSRIHHKNLVSLLGFCTESGEQMLVYEFMPNGTLKDSLSGKSGIVLDWGRRLRVALGSARGLAYLHELADPPIIHRDVKSSNILLDENLNAKVADFGLSKMMVDSQRSHVSTQVKGTMGYIDPEYYMTQQLTKKSDVYSFGVVMLELLTAKPSLAKGKSVVLEVKALLNGIDNEHYGLSNILDPVIRGSPNLVDFRKFVDLALRCVEELPVNRPTMSEVVKEIETMLQHESSNPPIAASSSTLTSQTQGASL